TFECMESACPGVISRPRWRLRHNTAKELQPNSRTARRTDRRAVAVAEAAEVAAAAAGSAAAAVGAAAAGAGLPVWAVRAFEPAAAAPALGYRRVLRSQSWCQALCSRSARYRRSDVRRHAGRGLGHT